MRRRRVGTGPLELTELGFGAATIGNLRSAVDDETARRAVEAAWQAGIRYFDTAPHYGLGLSERRLGQALAPYPREEMVLSTKVGRLLVPNPHPTGSDLVPGDFDVPDTLTRVRDYSADGVRRSLESSLDRLGTDRVDIVYVHDPEDYMEEAIGQALPALIELRRQGVVGAVGAGMNFWQPLLRIVVETDVDVVMVAGRWTLLDRSAAPLLEECERRGVAVVAASPFNSGLLARPWPPDGAMYDYGAAPADVLERARRLATICQERESSLPEAAMQFPLRHPAVVSVVSGMRNAGQVAKSVAYAQRTVPEPTWEALERACE